MKLLLDSDNHIFALARRGQYLPHMVVVVVMNFVIVLLAAIVGGSIALFINSVLSVATGEISADVLTSLMQNQDNQALLRLFMPTTALEQTIFLVLSFGPIFLLLWLWLAVVERRPFWTVGLERVGAIKKYLRGVLVGLVMFAASIAISAALGYIAVEKGNPQPQGWAALGGVLLVYLGWTVQGPAEELLHRGWLLPVIGARYRPVLGVIISSFVFMGLHGLNPNLSAIALFNLFLFGLFAALYVLYEGGLWGVFSIHAAWNWAQGNLFGFEVSGGTVPGGTLFDFMEVGPDIVTGGSFGPEGGLSVTTVLIAGCVVVWWLSKRRDTPDRVLDESK